jgi:hypothetical protein
MPARIDRADIVHEAGRRRLSPALRDGAPALVRTGDAAGRCGWAEFFAALDRAGLAVEFDPADEGAVRFVARASARAPRPSPGDRVRAAFAEARRFVAALRGRAKSS